MDQHSVSRARADFEDRLYHWLVGASGRVFSARERDQLTELLVDLVGYYGLQLGWARAWGDALAPSRIRHHIVLESQDAESGGGLKILGDARALPFANDSLDLIVLPHTLDFTTDRHQVLREVERVLIPEGRLVLVGFNPMSLWGLARLLTAGAAEFPWRGRFVPPRRVMDWLALLGFQVERQVPLIFLPPWWPLQRLEPLGLRWLSTWSGVYALRAVKRVAPLTPLTPKWRSQARVLAGQAVEPSIRRGVDG